MTPSPFDARREDLDGGIRVVAVRGELDMNTAPDLERLLDEATGSEEGSVILDLTECEFIDSTGIALIVRTWQKLDRGAGGDGKGRLVLCCDNQQVRRLLDITGVESSIPLFDDREAAVAELRG